MTDNQLRRDYLTALLAYCARVLAARTQSNLNKQDIVQGIQHRNLLQVMEKKTGVSPFDQYDITKIPIEAEGPICEQLDSQVSTIQQVVQGFPGLIYAIALAIEENS